ncbi:hypothetical protein GCM10010166_42230 [Couchioplanes caeruleus subsp. azureus]|nr:hypothetical protein GCM10010166_42230 [Couchioplanes caeruleus subsp. azureus]
MAVPMDRARDLAAALRGTALQFTTRRRPEPGTQAWKLAGQQMAMGEASSANSGRLAIAFTRGDEWFLHDRP